MSQISKFLLTNLDISTRYVKSSVLRIVDLLGYDPVLSGKCLPEDGNVRFLF
jgi:hypothetical protein